MCEELEEELREGQRAATLFVEHLERMKAKKVSYPITTDEGCYIITAVKTF